MIVSVCANVFDERPRQFTLASFDQLVYLIGSEHTIERPNEHDKTPTSTRLFNGVEFDGNGRKTENVVRVHFGVIDIDKKPLAHVQHTLSIMNGIPTFAYSTFSHGHKPDVSMRLIFPFSRPVESDEWHDYMAGFQSLTNKIIDTEKDPTRIYYLPVRRPDSVSHFMARTEGSRTFDVDACIRIGKQIRRDPGSKAAKRISAGTTEEDPFTLGSLKDLSATLKRNGKSASKEVAEALDKIIDGHVYSKDGERDNAIFRVCGAIAKQFPSVAPEIIAPYFVQSIGATNSFYKSGNDDTDLAKVVEKLTRLQARELELIAIKEDEAKAKIASDIRTFFARWQIKRDTPYTDHELDQIKQEIGAEDENELTRSWIIQNGSSYYRLSKFGYLPPVGERSLIAACRRDLAPAHEAGVSIYAISKDGDPIKRTPVDMMIDYGMVASGGAVIDLAAQATYYDRTTQRIIEAPCPLRKLTPENSPIIDDWLRALAGDTDEGFDKLRRWVAFATRLDKPCVILYLDGDPGTGKSLFVKGLSRLWTTSGAPSLGNAIGEFNTGPLHCPLVFADETMPDEMRGVSTARLREFQQNGSRMINRKGIPLAECVGYVRIALASNNKHMIETRETLTIADVSAIAERVLYLKTSQRAKAVLDALGAHVNDIVSEDILARHALYLASLNLPTEGRFLIATGDHNISKSLTVHSGDRPLVLHWLASYLQDPRKFNALNNQRVIVRNGTLYVKTLALVESWDMYITNAKAPATPRIADALKGISSEVKVLNINDHSHKFYAIKRELLHEWTIEHGIASPEEINAALAKPTVIPGGKALSQVKDPANPFSEAKS